MRRDPPRGNMPRSASSSSSSQSSVDVATAASAATSADMTLAAAEAAHAAAVTGNGRAASAAILGVGGDPQVEDLRGRLAARERRIRLLESSADASEDVLSEWQAKYDRLWEAHRRLQKTNHSLEDKLLRVVDKFEADRNQMTRDLASQTQKLVQAKLAAQQLRDRTAELQSDLQLAITLLQNKPSSYLPQRMGGLPQDVQGRVRSYVAERQQQQLAAASAAADPSSSGRKITVPIMDDVEEGNVGEDERVSAAILAKVLEERAKERRRDKKFCIDIGTQTHSWQFPDKLVSYSSPPTSSTSSTTTAPPLPPTGSTVPVMLQEEPSLKDDSKSSSSTTSAKQKKQRSRTATPAASAAAPAPPDQSGVQQHQQEQQQPETAEVIQILRSISLDESMRKISDSETQVPSAADAPSSTAAPVSNILFQASVIRPPPASVVAASRKETAITGDDTQEVGGARRKSPGAASVSTSTMPRSATFSSKQTDL